MLPDHAPLQQCIRRYSSGSEGFRHLLCVVYDAHWLEKASARTLTFVARRLVADPAGDPLLLRCLSEQLGVAGLDG